MPTSQRAPFAVKVVSSGSAAMTWFSEDFGNDLAPLFFLASSSTPTIVGMCGVYSSLPLASWLCFRSQQRRQRPTQKKKGSYIGLFTHALDGDAQHAQCRLGGERREVSASSCVHLEVMLFSRLPATSVLAGNLASLRAVTLRETATMSASDSNPYGMRWHRSMLRCKVCVLCKHDCM